MVNDITNGISVKLNSIYGDEYKIYDSNIRQELEQPCFFIKLIKVMNTPFLGKRKKREYIFNVHYFPVNDADTDNINAVGDMLMEGLEYITLANGDILRGKDMSYEVIDGVLHYNATYQVVLINTEKEDSMNQYGLDVGVRG